MVGTSDQPIRYPTASAVIVRRAPEPARRVMKKKIDAVTWLFWPKRWSRNW